MAEKPDLTFGAKPWSREEALGLNPLLRSKPGPRNLRVKVPRGPSISAPERNVSKGVVDAITGALSSVMGGDERAKAQRASGMSDALSWVNPVEPVERAIRHGVRQLSGGPAATGTDYLDLLLPAVGMAARPLTRLAAKTVPAGAARWLGESRAVPEVDDAVEGAFAVRPPQQQPLLAARPAPRALPAPQAPPAPLRQMALPAPEKRALIPYHPLPDTRGRGEFFHGARAQMPDMQEGYYNPNNIFGGFDTFYTTDALDVARGYQRKRPDGTVYSVGERAPVQFFNMEEPKTPEEIGRLFGVDYANDVGFPASALEEAVGPDGVLSLRGAMDEIRRGSSYEGYTKDDVQEIFDSAITNLRDKGFGGMTHVGGKITGAPEHTVRVYFDAPNQLDLNDIGGWRPNYARGGRVRRYLAAR